MKKKSEEIFKNFVCFLIDSFKFNLLIFLIFLTLFFFSEKNKIIRKIFSGFVICWMPFFVLYLIEVFFNEIVETKTFPIASELFLWLGYSNSVSYFYGFAWYYLAGQISNAILKSSMNNCSLVNIAGTKSNYLYYV